MAYQFEYHRTVTFVETDMAGIMHFSNFFRLMEEAEHAFFRSLGLSVHPEGSPVGWPRVHAGCDFHKPLRFEEEVRIEVLVEEVRSKAVRYLFRFWKDGGATPELSAVGRVTAVCVSLDPGGKGMRAVPVPDEVREKITAAPGELLGEK